MEIPVISSSLAPPRTAELGTASRRTAPLPRRTLGGLRALGGLGALALTLALGGCGGDEESNPGGSGGTTLGGSGGTGGVSVTGGVGGTGAVGGTQPDSCPPAGSSLPWTGPWMSGPNPGPCSATGGLAGPITYVYDDAGTLLRGELADGRTEVYTRDEQGRIIAIDDGDNHADYDYSVPGICVETRYQGGTLLQTMTYTLDATGRPTVTTSSTVTGQYVYEDCRLVRFEGLASSASLVLTYFYDDAGNLVRRDQVMAGGAPTTMTFDYSCW